MDKEPLRLIRIHGGLVADQYFLECNGKGIPLTRRLFEKIAAEEAIILRAEGIGRMPDKPEYPWIEEVLTIESRQV